MSRSSLKSRIKRSASVFIGERREALKNMNARLRKKIAQIDKMMYDSIEQTIRFYYALGEEILDVRNNEDQKYGEQPMKQLEIVYETTKRTLYKAAQFRETITERELEMLIAIRNDDGVFRLNHQHIVYLLAFPTQRLRMQFAKRAAANLWTPKDLMRAIQRYQGKSKYAGPGRGHKLPKTMGRRIQQMVDMTRAWVTKYKLFWNGTGEEDENAFAGIMAEPPENLFSDDLDNLLALRDLLKEMPDDATDMKKLVDRAVQRFRKVLRQRASTDQADESLEGGPARQARAIDLGDGEQPKKRRRAAETAPA